MQFLKANPWLSPLPTSVTKKGGNPQALHVTLGLRGIARQVSKKRFKYSDFCQSCRKPLGSDEKIVYVEESANRYFCSEKCIRAYYDPMAEHYRKEMLAIRDPHDISESEFAEYESYAPLCLSNPDEVWEDTTEFGEVISYHIAAFTNEGGKFTYVVACFCLEDEPTYILTSFPTRDKKLVEEFRRGEKLEFAEGDQEVPEPEVSPVLADDFLARQGNAIEEEMLRHRSAEDVPSSEFEDFVHLVDQTIENPDEVWELQDEGDNPLLTLISQHEEHLYYVVICAIDASQEQQENWRVIYSFPTRDQSLVQRYRRGQLREGGAGKGSFLH